MNQLVLVMIIRNESKIITRCLDNVKNLISAVCIIDTGSTDSTVQTVNKWLLENKIKGQILEREWKNFGWNRSESFTEAKKWVKDNNFILNQTYALFIDADMIFKKLDNYNPNHLKEKGYLLRQYHNLFSYYNLRLARFDQNWVCEGVTHEYWKIKDEDYYSGAYDYLEIEDREDGGCKSDKFERDKRLLEKGLEEEPNNVRYLFYLAQTYSCLSEYEKSNEYYQKRIEKGGWYEEVWYSHFKIVTNYLSMDKPLEALEWCLKGYHFYKFRSEAFDAICKYMRENNKNNISYFLADFAEKIKLKKEDKLFISLDCYKFKFIETKTFTAFYCHNISEGYSYCHKLLDMKDYNNKDLTLQNLLFYLPSILIQSVNNINKKCSNLCLYYDSMDKCCYIDNNKLYIGKMKGNELISETLIKDLNAVNDIENIHWIDQDNIIINTKNENYVLNVNNKNLDKYKNNWIPVKNSTNKINNKYPLTITNNKDETILQINIYKATAATNFIILNDGYLGLLKIHEERRNKLYYLFFWYSKDLKTVKKSKIFYFINKGEEEINSLSKANSKIYLINYSNSAYKLIEISENVINGMLECF
jgi:hypothetical protein